MPDAAGPQAEPNDAPPLPDALERLRADLLEDLPAAVAEALRKDEAAGEPLLDAEDVARRLNVSERTVERLVADGELRPLWIRGQRRFTSQTVNAYIRSAAGGQRGNSA